MLCNVCFRMLQDHEGFASKGPYDIAFYHHMSGAALERSKDLNCSICKVLFDGLAAQLNPADAIRPLRLSVNASLSAVGRTLDQTSYLLDMVLRCEGVTSHGHFVLKETDSAYPLLRTLDSRSTSSNEVHQLVQHWMSRCKCIDLRQPPSWYPARLISLADIQKQIQRNANIDQACINLEETEDWRRGRPDHQNVRYVSLSHCWGPDPKRQLKMTPQNIAEFKRGLPLSKMPPTFRDAVTFAARLPQVGYIWIDSLCIKQGDTADWLVQSVTMGKVYSESFLNISATASTNSDGGLFRSRSPEEAILNVQRVPAARIIPKDLAQSIGLASRASRAPIGHGPNAVRGRSDQNHLKCCKILDGAFWTNQVENATINRRGWVIQERLLSPRVLHFCHNQVAWECAEFDATETSPQGTAHFKTDIEDPEKENMSLSLDPNIDGRRLRQERLEGYPEMDSHLLPKIYAFELWNKIVENYTRTAITQPGDKLIALAGIAQDMAQKIGSTSHPARYIAGLWKPHLASQLLWYVEPVYRSKSRTFSHLSRAPQQHYRAPSFSWASIDAEQANGVVCGEVTDRDILIEVKDAVTRPEPGSNDYAKVASGHIDMCGKLRKATITSHPNGRYGWQLVGRGRELDAEPHTNVYLDCPDRDKENILGAKAGVYVMPVARGKRASQEKDKHMICLILQLVNGGRGGPRYRRIGLTKLSPWEDRVALGRHGISKVGKNDGELPHQGYDVITGMHRILLI